MERWLLTFFIGAICAFFLPLTPTTYYVILFALVAMLFLCIKGLKLYSGFFFALSWVFAHGSSYQNIWLANNIDDADFFAKTHLITGRIDTLYLSDKAEANHSSHRFNIEVFSIDQQILARPIKLRLSWDHQQSFLITKKLKRERHKQKQPKQGQEWQLMVKIKPAHGFANIGGFSYQTWLRHKDIHASGYVKNHVNNALNKSDTSFRQALFAKTESMMPKHHLAPLIYALSYGERSAISAQHWQVLQATGTQHLMAISGLHLGLVATGAFYFFNFILKILPWTWLSRLGVATGVNLYLVNVNTRVLAVVLSCLVAFIYAYLAGFSLPTIRALVMLLLYWLSRLSAIKLSLSLWLLLTLFILILIEPMALISASFWLSVYAVSIIFLMLWRLSSFQKNNLPSLFWLSWLKSLAIVQLGLTMLMLPIVALYSQQISTVAFLANIVAVPWMSFTTIPLCLLSLISMNISSWLSEALLMLALSSLDIIWFWLERLTAQSWALLSLSAYSAFCLALLVFIAAFVWFLRLERYLFKSVAVIAISLLFTLFLTYFLTVFSSDANKDKWQVSVMDVGQGLAIVIEKNHKAIIYDTGASYPSGFNMAESVLMPYLQFQGISQIDKVLISHQDNDHAGGLKKLRENIAIDSVLANSEILSADSLCSTNQSFIWQGLSFDIIWPLTGKALSAKTNDRSCVIKVSDNQHSILLTGDISKKVEQQLVEQKLLPTADVVIVPHHGSLSSSSEAFISTLNVETAIVSSGFMNRWNMPKPAVVKRYLDKNIKLHNTATQGMVSVLVSDNSLKVKQYRQDVWPFWFAN